MDSGSAQAAVIGLLRQEGASDEEILLYLTDRRRGAGMSRTEAVMYLRLDSTSGTTQLVTAGLVSETRTLGSAHARPPERSRWMTRAVWLVILTFILCLAFADPLLHWICYAGLDASNGAACRHVNPRFNY